MELSKIKEAVTSLETQLQKLGKEIELAEVRWSVNRRTLRNAADKESQQQQQQQQVSRLGRKNKADVFKLFFQQKLVSRSGASVKETDIWKCANRFMQPLDMKLSKADVRRFMLERGYETTTPTSPPSKRAVTYRDVDFVENCNDISRFIQSDTLQFRDVAT